MRFVNQALFGSHIDPADAVLREGEGKLLPVERQEKASEARKEALASWVGACVSVEMDKETGLPSETHRARK